MVKKESELKKLISTFEEILKVSEKHFYLFDDETIMEGKSLDFAGGWIAQDETFSIAVEKYGDRILIGGANFEYEPCQKGGGLSARQAALRIKKNFSGYNITAKDLKKQFYTALKEPLGKYLANKTLEGKI